MNKNFKFILTLSGLITLFVAIIYFMFFYFNNLYSPNKTNLIDNKNFSNEPLLPILSGENETENSNSLENTNPENNQGFESSIEKINSNLENKTKEELLKDLKVLEIEKSPVSSFVTISKSTTSEAAIVYIKKDSGEIIKYQIKNKTKTSVSPGDENVVGESFIKRDGSYAALRRADKDGIYTQIVNLKNDTKIKLEDNIKSMAFFERKDFIVYGLKEGDGFTLKTMNLKNKEIKDFAKLQMTEWLLSVDGEDNVRALLKPTGTAEGLSFVINQATKKISLETKPILGLDIKQIDSKRYSLMSSGGFEKNELLMLDKKTNNIFSLSENTFLEKCAFEILKSGVVCVVPKKLDNGRLYPDDFYKGLVNGKDNIIYKSLNSSTSLLLYSFKDSQISPINPSVSNNGIFFMDSKSLMLYSLES